MAQEMCWFTKDNSILYNSNKTHLPKKEQNLAGSVAVIYGKQFKV